jgi:hypothetical protein
VLALQKQALKVGIGVVEFLDLTPRETYMAIEAAIWRDERRQKQDVALAWRTAALVRAKRMPSLKQLLAIGPARPLAGKEKEKRRREYKEMSAAADDYLQKLNKRKEQSNE